MGMSTEFKDKIILTNDKPVEIGEDIFDHDTLNYKASVERLTNLITCTQKPYTMGVFGDWGSGKTSFMRMLQACLEKENYATYWFDAWKYEYENDLIVPLLHGLSEQFSRVSKSIREELCKSASVIGLSFADIFLRTSTAGTCTSEDIKKNLESYEEKSSKFYKYHSDQVIRLEGAFKDCVKDVLKTEENSLVIFIDDLDRCMPENVIGLLEKIKNYLTMDDCRVLFVIGVDKGMLEKSVIVRYGSDLIEADRYLEKIINLSADVPTSNVDIEKFIKTEFKHHFLLPNQDEENLKNIFIQIVKDSKINNPRKLKRLITRYLFYIVLRKRYTKVLPQLIIYLLICKEYYPDTYQWKKEKNAIYDWEIDFKGKIKDLGPTYFQDKGIKIQQKDYLSHFEATDFIYSLTF